MRLLLALALGLASTATAQPTGPSPRGAVGIDGILPLQSVRLSDAAFDERLSTGLSTVVAVRGRLTVSERLQITAEVPVAAVTLEGSDVTVGDAAGRSREVGLGNPSLGVEWRLRPGPREVALVGGLRLPLASGDAESPLLPGRAAGFGAAVLPEEREAFLPRLVSVRLALRARRAVARNVRLALEAGPVLGVSTETVLDQPSPAAPGAETRPTFGTMVYRLSVEGRTGLLALTGGVIGTERLRSLDDYFASPVTVAVAEVALRGAVRPRLRARLPLRDFSGEPSIGLGVAVTL